MNINKELRKAFEDVPPGTYLTLAQIAAKCDVGTGALATRLFGGVLPLPEEIIPVNSPYRVKGAVKIIT